MSSHHSRIGYLGKRFAFGAILLAIVALCMKEFRTFYILGILALLAALGFAVSWLGERRYKKKNTIEVDELGNAKKKFL